jgi:hypothetical protein
MDVLRLLRWKVSLVATLALLLHSLMPVVMPARAAFGSPADWVEVCSGGKVLLVATTGLDAKAAITDPGRRNSAKTALDDCSTCSHHSTAAAQSQNSREPPAVPVRLLSVELASDLLDPHFTWATAHTRSPPSLN